MCLHSGSFARGCLHVRGCLCDADGRWHCDFDRHNRTKSVVVYVFDIFTGGQLIFVLSLVRQKGAKKHVQKITMYLL